MDSKSLFLRTYWIVALLNHIKVQNEITELIFHFSHYYF